MRKIFSIFPFIFGSILSFYCIKPCNALSIPLINVKKLSRVTTTTTTTPQTKPNTLSAKAKNNQGMLFLKSSLLLQSENENDKNNISTTTTTTTSSNSAIHSWPQKQRRCHSKNNDMKKQSHLKTTNHDTSSSLSSSKSMHKRIHQSKTRFRFGKKVVSILLMILVTTITICPPAMATEKIAAAASSSATATTTFSSPLGIRNVSAAAFMLASLAILPLYITTSTTTTTGGLKSLSTSLIISASRCAIQVFFLGSVLLQRIMGTTQPLFVMAWIIGVGIIAGKEAYSRSQYTYPTMKRHVYLSILIGGISVLFFSLLFNVLGNNNLQPWYQPRVWIPVAGMLFGNTLSASALGISTITKLFVTQQGQIELFLLRGATHREATISLVRDALFTALTPTINGLAVTGIVHIPGMMTGQILAGQSPSQAAAYQVMINFLIATTACTTVQLLIQAAVRSLVDRHNHRLYLNKLTTRTTTTTTTTQIENNNNSKSKNKSKRNLLLSLASSAVQGFSKIKSSNSLLVTEEGTNAACLPTEDISTPINAIVAKPMSDQNKKSNNDDNNNKDDDDGDDSDSRILLEAKQLHVPRANANVTFQCKPGNRIGITGKSGVGKSQILRTLAQMEEWDGNNNNNNNNNGELSFHGENVSKLSIPEYRTRVCLVPQSIPVLEGTPRMFYEQIQTFQKQRNKNKNSKDVNNDKDNTLDSSKALLSKILQKMQLQGNENESKNNNNNNNIIDRPWSTLSGGEAQRVSLAIALALQPEILLLDESTSALDESTCKIVESILKETKIPIIMVTHSIDQLNRFCTHRIEI